MRFHATLDRSFSHPAADSLDFVSACKAIDKMQSKLLQPRCGGRLGTESRVTLDRLFCLGIHATHFSNSFCQSRYAPERNSCLLPGLHHPRSVLRWRKRSACEKTERNLGM